MPSRESAAHRGWWVVYVLLMAYTFAFIDRQLLNLLVDPIKNSFRLSDTQISLLQGLAFAVAYALAAPLAGRWADTGHRRNIALLGVALWSLCTGGCGICGSYFLLFAARVGVGCAESLLMPAAWSLIADYFPKEQLPKAMGRFLLGPYLGGGLALILGGSIFATAGRGSVPLGSFGELEPWRVSFLVAGVLGAIPTALMLSFREPVRRELARQSATTFSLRQIVEFLWARRAFYCSFYSGMSAHTVALFAYQAWLPAFFARSYGRPLSQIGLEYGTVVLVMGCLGVLSGPLLGRWLQRRGRFDYALRVPAIGVLCLVPLVATLPFCGTYSVALWVCGAITFFCTLPLPMAASALQQVTPNRMRGVASSIYIFAVSIIGVTIPPALIALLTDHVFHNPAKIGWSLTIVGLASSLAAAAILFRGLGAYRMAVAEHHR